MTDKSNSAHLALNLTNLSVIKTSGKDALEFLNNQFTNDLASLESNRWQFSGYCNAKGRLISIMRVFRHDDHVYLLLSSAVCDIVLKRLKIYVFRAKVEFEILTDACVQFSTDITAEDNNGLMQQFEYQADQQGFILNLSGKSKRCLFIQIQPPEQSESLVEHPAHTHYKWRLSEIHDGIPSIYAETIEKFIPQHVNLDQINGISFTKGCFPGQEVVARLHYLGKSKKTMRPIEINSSIPLNPGDSIKHPESSNSLILVDAIVTRDQTYQCLAVGQFD